MLGSEHEPGDFDRLAELIRDIQVGLLTTVDREGQFHTRPVQTLRVANDRTLWFFTDWNSPKADELRHDLRVSLGYCDASNKRYVAIAGEASIFRDAAQARELWTIEQRAYYPQGPEDERLALLCVRIERAEYWIAPGRASYLVAALKAAVTGTPASVIGENRKLTPKRD
jgi:general stress protein 26